MSQSVFDHYAKLFNAESKARAMFAKTGLTVHKVALIRAEFERKQYIHLCAIHGEVMPY